QTWLGKRHDSLATAETSVDLRQRLVEEHPDVPQFANDLASSYMELGLSRRMLYGATAAEAFGRACALREDLVKAHPGVLQFEFDLPHSYRKLAETFRMQQEPDKALPYYHRAWPLLDKLARESPTVADFRYHLASCHAGIALVHWSKKQPAEALRG